MPLTGPSFSELRAGDMADVEPILERLAGIFTTEVRAAFRALR